MVEQDFEDYDSDHEVSVNHSKLIDAVRQLDKGQRVRKPERSEPSLQVSEFHLIKSGISDSDAIDVKALARTLRQKSSHVQISKKVNVAQEEVPVLKKPLEKPAAERIKRQTGFDNVKKELGKWNGIVARNRTAATVKFPLNQPSMKLQDSDTFLQRFRLQSDLQKKLAELEPQPEPVKEDVFSLTVQEIIEKRQEAARLRAQQSYREAKAHRQNKIKSKKFHRIQRRERDKKLLKEFEELQKTDPEAALEKLELLEKTRAKERMTLRHKSTGQWAKNKQIRAKYDKDCRQDLAEQLAISKELTRKVKQDDDSDDDEADNNEPNLNHINPDDKDNPWMKPVKSESEIDQFLGVCRKYWETKNNEKKLTNDSDKVSNQDKSVVKPFKEVRIENRDCKSVISSTKSEVANGVEQNITIPKAIDKKKCKTNNKNKLKYKKSGTSRWVISEIEDVEESKHIDLDKIFERVEDNVNEKICKKVAEFNNEFEISLLSEKKDKKSRKAKVEYENELDKLGLKSQRPMRPVIDEPLSYSNEDSKQAKTNLNTVINPVKSTKSSAEIDPNNFMVVKTKYMKTALPNDMLADALDDNDVEDDQQQLISEAFADDDVVDEFRKEKEEEIRKSQPEDIDLSLPGWGSWGGKNINVSQRKKKRFIIKMPKDAPRRDENKGDIIIVEQNSAKLRKHLVSDLPYPFTSVKDYEASIRAPIGREFVTEQVHSKLIQPTVKTKLGQVIEPMDEDILINTKNIKRKISGTQTIDVELISKKTKKKK